MESSTLFSRCTTIEYVLLSIRPRRSFTPLSSLLISIFKLENASFLIYLSVFRIRHNVFCIRFLNNFDSTGYGLLLFQFSEAAQLLRVPFGSLFFE